MARRPDHQFLRGRMAWIAVLLALLVLTSGLSRLFVVCLGHHGEPRIETVHAGGCCNEHEHCSSEHPDCDHGGCIDRTTLLATRPPSAEDLEVPDVADGAPPPPDWRAVKLAVAPRPVVRRVLLRPPCRQQRLQLRRSIVLLI